MPCKQFSEHSLLFFQGIPAAAAAAKSLQSCPTLCDPRDGSPPGFPILGILQARTLEWSTIAFSNLWKWKVKSLSRVRLLATPWTTAYQAPPSMGFPGKSTGVGCHCLLRKEYLLFVKSFHLPNTPNLLKQVAIILAKKQCFLMQIFSSQRHQKHTFS